MPRIEICHPHSLTPAKARKAATEIAKTLAKRFGVDYEWKGDLLTFRRSGVEGEILMAPKQLQVTAQLGFLLGAMKGSIEQEIRRVLDERFPA